MSDDVADAVIASLEPVIAGIQATFGPWCEVVLHDFREGGRSVVAIAGEVTGRSVGGAPSEIGLRLMAQKDTAENDVNYPARTTDGRILRCSSLPLRDEDGHVFGALAINLDVTALRQVEDLVACLGGRVPAAPERMTAATFTDDFNDVLEAVIQSEERKLGTSVDELTRMKRLDLMMVLDARGVFDVRGSAQRVAQRLGVSKSVLYNDLAEARRRAERQQRRALA